MCRKNPRNSRMPYALFWPANERLILHSGEEEQKATDVVVAVGRFETNLKNEWIMEYTPKMVVCMMSLRHVFLAFFGVVFNISSSPWKRRWSKFEWLFFQLSGSTWFNLALNGLLCLQEHLIWITREIFSSPSLMASHSNLDPRDLGDIGSFVGEGTFKNPASPNVIPAYRTRNVTGWKNPPRMKIFQLVMLQ